MKTKPWNQKETLKFIQQCRNLILNGNTSEETLNDIEEKLHLYNRQNGDKTNQAYDLLGRLYLRRNDYTKARKYLEKAQMIYPYSAGTFYQLFKIDVIEEKYEDAYSHLKRHVQILERKNINNHFESTFTLLSLIHKMKIYPRKWDSIPIEIKYRRDMKDVPLQIMWDTYCDFVEERDWGNAYTILSNANEYIRKKHLPIDISSEMKLVQQIQVLIYQRDLENNRKLYQYHGDRQSLQETLSKIPSDTIEFARSCNYLIESGSMKNSTLLDEIPNEFLVKHLKQKKQALSYLRNKDNELAVAYGNRIERDFVKQTDLDQIFSDATFAYHKTKSPHLLWYLLKLSYLSNNIDQFKQYQQEIEQSEVASNFVSLHALEYRYYCYQLETSKKKKELLQNEIDAICSLEENKDNREMPKQYIITKEVKHAN